MKLLIIGRKALPSGLSILCFYKKKQKKQKSARRKISRHCNNLPDNCNRLKSNSDTDINIIADIPPVCNLFAEFRMVSIYLTYTSLGRTSSRNPLNTGCRKEFCRLGIYSTTHT